MDATLNSLYGSTGIGRNVSGLSRIKEVLKYGDARHAASLRAGGDVYTTDAQSSTPFNAVEALMIARYAVIGVGYVLLFLLITL